MSNPFKEQLAKKTSINAEQKRKEEEATIKLLSLFQKGRDITEKDQEEFMKIDRNLFSKEMYRMIYDLVKTGIETGKIPEIEGYMQSYKKRRKISLEQIPKKWEKAPEQNRQGGDVR